MAESTSSTTASTSTTKTPSSKSTSALKPAAKTTTKRAATGTKTAAKRTTTKRTTTAKSTAKLTAKTGAKTAAKPRTTAKAKAKPVQPESALQAGTRELLEQAERIAKINVGAVLVARDTAQKQVDKALSFLTDETDRSKQLKKFERRGKTALTKTEKEIKARRDAALSERDKALDRAKAQLDELRSQVKLDELRSPVTLDDLRSQVKLDELRAQVNEVYETAGTYAEKFSSYSEKVTAPVADTYKDLEKRLQRA